jgi:hypothetical protein
MKILINESRLDQIMRSYIKKELGKFIPSSDEESYGYVGGFHIDPQDDIPFAYIRYSSDFKTHLLYIGRPFYNTLKTMFSINTINDMILLETILVKAAKELINDNSINVGGIDIYESNY